MYSILNTYPHIHLPRQQTNILELIVGAGSVDETTHTTQGCFPILLPFDEHCNCLGTLLGCVGRQAICHIAQPLLLGFLLLPTKEVQFLFQLLQVCLFALAAFAC